MSRQTRQATIGVWSPTLLGVILHSVPASLLVSIKTSYGCIRISASTSLNCTAAEVADLVNELQDVSEWWNFGLNLGIEMPRLEAIQVDCPTLGERRIQMLNEWQKKVTPTWPAVVQALEKIGLRRRASELAQKYGWLNIIHSIKLIIMKIH